MEKTANVLITGASGLLGRQIYKYLTDENLRNRYPVSDLDEFKWITLGLCYSRVKGNLRAIDLNDFEEVDKLIQEFKPDVILHCAAERKVENVENDFEGALKLNKGVTQYLAEVTAKLGILFVYISTDYVFDGKNPPYKIDDKPNPLNKYGFSKLSGEEVTLNASKDHCIVRVPVLYGFTEPNKFNESAVNILYEKVKKGDLFKIDHVQTRFPTHCLDVARFCTQLIINNFKNPSNPTRGIFHCSGLDAFTKYEMSCVIADQFQINKEHIKPDLTVDTSGLRPDNSQLDTTDSYAKLNFKPVMNFRDSIKECLEVFV